MSSDNASFLFDRPPQPPWGTLEAIEAPGFPQSHLRVPLPEHREALSGLIRGELNDSEAFTGEDPRVKKWLAPPVSLEQSDGTESLIFYLHEDAWGRDGDMVGCLGLWRTEQERQAGVARIGAFVTHTFEKELLGGAVHCLLAHGQETWGWGDLDGVAWTPISYNDDATQTPLLLPLPALPALTAVNALMIKSMNRWVTQVIPECPSTLSTEYKVHNIKNLMNDVKYQWEGARRFYSSESGVLISEWYDQSDRLHKAIGKDMELCEEGVIVNGLYELSQLRSFIMPHLQRAIERGVSVEVSMSAFDLSDEYYPDYDTRPFRDTARQLEEMGATVEAQPSRGMYSHQIIIDRRIFYAPAHGMQSNYLTRTEAASQIPLPLIRDRRIV